MIPPANDQIFINLHVTRGHMFDHLSHLFLRRGGGSTSIEQPHQKRSGLTIAFSAIVCWSGAGGLDDGTGHDTGVILVWK